MSDVSLLQRIHDIEDEIATFEGKIESAQSHKGFVGRLFDRETYEELEKVPIWEAQAETKRKQVAELRLLMDNQPAVTDRIAWKGTHRQFADWILSAFEEHNLDATTKTNALTKACKHFVDAAGNPFDPKSLLQNVRNRADLEGK